jgi:hypothetical protein
MNRSSTVLPIWKLEEQTGDECWSDTPLPRHEPEPFLRGMFAAIVIEAAVAGVGILLWKCT